MNKRIQELMTQSMVEYQFQHRFSPEKFAELIVRECAVIGERYADGNYEIRNQILIHFGLEEPEE